MNLKMRCQHCSEFKQVESDKDSAFSRCEIAHKNGWTAFVDTKSKIPLYFCTTECEQRYRLKTKTHLQIVGMVSR